MLPAAAQFVKSCRPCCSRWFWQLPCGFLPSTAADPVQAALVSAPVIIERLIRIPSLVISVTCLSGNRDPERAKRSVWDGF
jgi:hypothetical protein